MELHDHITIIDVRPKTEFNICHLPGSASESVTTMVIYMLVFTILQTYHSPFYWPIPCLASQRMLDHLPRFILFAVWEMIHKLHHIL
jgi:hypothetical protein